MNFTPLGGSGTHEGFCLIKSVEKKLTAKGVPYLDLVIADNDGEIGAKLWDYRETPSNQFKKFDFVKVRGTFVPFNDTTQFRVERIRAVLPEDDVAIEDYVPSACLTGEVMLAEIEKIVDGFENGELKTLVSAVIDEYREKIIYWPAAKNLHHAVRSGLLMHTLSILRLANAVCKIYGFVNYDLLCSGAILHDIAKIDELEASSTGIASEYTVRGNLLGHLVMGAIRIDEIGKANGVSQETLTLVEQNCRCLLKRSCSLSLTFWMQGFMKCVTQSKRLSRVRSLRANGRSITAAFITTALLPTAMLSLSARNKHAFIISALYILFKEEQ